MTKFKQCREKVVEMLCDGYSLKKIAVACDVCKQTMSGWVKDLVEEKAVIQTSTSNHIKSFKRVKN